MAPIPDNQPAVRDGVPPSSRREEILAFIVLSIISWPLSVGIVGAYGFIVWMFQLIYGPPGPPHH